MSYADKEKTLAIYGGTPVRTKPLPGRNLFGIEEKNAAMQLFNRAMETGQAFGYNGEEEREFEKEFATWMGGGFADGVNSGTNAIFAALASLELPAGSEVVIPPVTDPGGCMPVVILNDIPIQADSMPDSYNMGPEQLEAVITENTKAVIVAHIGGIPADMESILAVARKHNLFVIEDCAQAHGAKLNGRLVGTFGDIASFSTMFGKHIATGGQGGVVYTKNEELHWRGRRLADRGKPFNLQETSNVVPALNLNLNDLSATIGRVQLKKLPDIVEHRRSIVRQIRNGIRNLKSVTLMQEPENSESSYWFLVFRVNENTLRVNKDTFAEAVAAEGFSVTIKYNHIPAEAFWYRNHATAKTPWLYRGKLNDHPNIRNAQKTIESHFNISIHEGFDEQTVADMIEALIKVESVFLKS